MTPTLPQADPHPERRARELADAREKYTFDWSYHGLAAVADLPAREAADPRWWAGVAGNFARLAANDLAARGKRGVESLAHEVAEGLSRFLPDAVVQRRLAHANAKAPDPVKTYDQMYATIAAPPIVDLWQRDDVFAWQAVAGTNPVMLTRLRQRMPNFALTDAQYAAAMGGESFDRALAEGRLYVADYAALDGLPEGSVDGLPKRNFAPIALYAWVPDAGRLVAVGIQCGQTPTRAFTPLDGTSWRMARNCVATAEGNFQGIVSHFALCHQVMESVILSARRQLSERHPLMVLLAPHFAETLLVNAIAFGALVGPGGYMERLQSPTLDASLSLSERAIRDFRLVGSAPPLDFARRGVDDPTALGEYPARDDALLLWGALSSFVKGYVELYYPSDADVAADPELAAWVAELGAEDGGRLGGIERPTTVAAVVDLVASIVYRCTGYHAQFNYSSFDLFSWPPNVQVAAFAPGPTGGPGDTEEAWAAMLPPIDLAWQAFTLFYEITLQLSRLGDYPARHFDDPRVAPLLAAHQADLQGVEAEIERRNQGRLVPYPWMAPSRVPLSIHV